MSKTLVHLGYRVMCDIFAFSFRMPDKFNGTNRKGLENAQSLIASVQDWDGHPGLLSTASVTADSRVTVVQY